ncbi:protein-disulfide reductase DsbD family protein [Sphingomonas cavernae]|uniref:Thiol:disulfide interchange protein n=1 Tax=Sphingomonas cavernae TaxID=2320861 RepID=A0A418WNB9_9SPHN|nr:thioredoxin family protein [Sphingomonas cavernae]RJF91487.1 thiol:disulfide interchange protein [Sphingomonas cavernae]
MKMLRFAIMTLLSLLLGTQAHAQAQPTHIKPALIAESVVPAAGGIVTLALAMKPDRGWHGYWKNPGDAGITPEFNWTLPAGVTAADAEYPVPHRLMLAGLMNYVYEGDYAHLITLTLPAGLAKGTKLPIQLAADWLACTDQVCVPESGTMAIELVVGDGTIDAGRKGQFDRWRALLPRPLGSEGRFEVAGGNFRLGVPLPASATLGEVYFFPLTDGAIDYAAPQTVRRDGDMLTIEVKAAGAAGELKVIDGVLALDKDKGLALKALPGKVSAAGAIVGPADTGRMEGAGGLAGTLLASFGAALLGGLLLNIMPCVFPILSLKALSLARSGGHETAARREALAYTAGIVLVCVGLGAALLGLRAGGSAAGWAFQLQDPRVILFLLLLVSAVAFNLAGLFDFASLGFGNRLAAQGGTTGAFWTGALAAFVATPCTGPFMGVALGAALVLPPIAALTIFAGLGLGLALPFLALGFIPALRKRLPKPGAWMERFQRILSIPMFVTALGLAWILGRQAGVDGMAMGLAAALVLGLALWWIGRRQSHGDGRNWLALAPAAAVAMAMILTVSPAPKASAGAPAAGILAAEPFSEARLAALQQEGRPVFVYFTADWCLSCKVNEKAAIQRQEVADAFAARRVAVLVGDWTDGDPVIGRFIESHGRSGVPLYLFYKPGGAPEILPQVLTPERLTALAV